jgi:hypothetical protein
MSEENRERAGEMLANGALSRTDIAKALDEAERRGYGQGFKDARVLLDDLTQIRRAYEIGAEKMRERAAKFASQIRRRHTAAIGSAGFTEGSANSPRRAEGRKE